VTENARRRTQQEIARAARYRVVDKGGHVSRGALWKKHRLLAAPTWAEPSDALLETQQEIAARAARAQREDAAVHAHVGSLGPRDPDSELQELVYEFGARVVTTLMRRTRPEFRLPRHLMNGAPMKGE
jgi:hypothetical protein